MKITVQRYKSTDKATNGQMFIDGEFFCYTLEDVVREDGVKIYGETAIPEGTYRITLYPFRGDKDRVYPHLDRVPGFQGIAIHGGNTADQTNGCILVGYREAKDWIGECALALEQLLRRIRYAADDVWIEVKNG